MDEEEPNLQHELDEKTDILMAYRAIVSLTTLALAITLGCLWL